MKKVYIAIIFTVLFNYAQGQQTNWVCDTIINHANSGDGTIDMDAVVCDFFPTTNIANTDETIFDSWTTNGTPFIYRALTKFNLNTIPANAVIQSAKLVLFYNANAIHGSNSVYPGSPNPTDNDGTIYRINQSWNVNTLTWNNQPTYSVNNAVLIPASSSTTQGLNINVAPLVADMIANPTTSFGFLLKLNNENPYRQQVYAASNHTNVNLHPRLQICYTYATAVNNVLDSKLINVVAQNNNLNITNTSGIKIEAVKIFNTLGQCILHKSIDNTLNNIIALPNNLNSGVYFVKLYNANGNISKQIVLGF